MDEGRPTQPPYLILETESPAVRSILISTATISLVSTALLLTSRQFHKDEDKN